MIQVLRKLALFIIPLIIGISSASAEVTIQNDQQFISSDGALHIVGEIQNNMDAAINQIDVQATIFSKKGDVIDTRIANSMVNTIMPGMKGPFEILILGNDANKVKTYSLDVDYKISASKSQVIDISSSELSRDKLDNLMITGTVTNKGDITANTISIVATLYDKNGNVAGVSKIHTEPDYLRTDDKAFFLVSVPDKIQTDSVIDYLLVAESEEYAAVPEFPIGSLILLTASLGAYVAITKYPNRFIANLVSASNLK